MVQHSFDRRAIIFDCDGVLADTEPHGHLLAFNKMWERLDVPWRWSAEQYKQKLKTAGGRERLASLFEDSDFLQSVQPPSDDARRAELINRWHKEKSAIYQTIINSGQIPIRPGIRRLALAASEAGWRLAVASTSTSASVSAVLNAAMGDLASEFVVLAGDVVKAKKPSPEIYDLAVAHLRIPPSQCVAIEDSRNGLLAASRANIPVLITISEYTSTEAFPEAALVVDSLGDPQGPDCAVLANRLQLEIGDFITLDDMEGIVQREIRRQCGLGA
jgi:HAD superfamily hydrolase (TIGR01509 family)